MGKSSYDRYATILTPVIVLGQISAHCVVNGQDETQGLYHPPRRSGFEPSSRHVEFVDDEETLGQVFFEYFGSPCQFSFR
jgi:hypothetical protein